jgi:Zn-dependent protease
LKVIGLRWRWYGVALVADPNGKPEQLLKVALGGLAATALLALGFAVNAALLFTNLVPVRWLDGGQILAGIRQVRRR